MLQKRVVIALVIMIYNNQLSGFRPTREVRLVSLPPFNHIGL